MTQGPEFLIVAFVKLEQGLNKGSIIIVGVLINSWSRIVGHIMAEL